MKPDCRLNWTQRKLYSNRRIKIGEGLEFVVVVGGVGEVPAGGFRHRSILAFSRGDQEVREEHGSDVVAQLLCVLINFTIMTKNVFTQRSLMPCGKPL